MLNLTTLFIIAFLAGFLFPSCQQTQKEHYDLAILDAMILDGTGNEAYKGHIFINADTIAKIEKDTDLQHDALNTIKANGKIVSPGFIDTHAHGDPLATPEFENFLSMGVTTISLGQDGFSPQYEHIQEWMDTVQQVQPSVNIAMFAGHNTLRMLSGIEYDTIPSEEGLQQMQTLLASTMEAGCFGMTTGLEYNPGYYASSDELNFLAKTVGKHNGIIMSHMRNEDDDSVEASIRELLAQGAFCPVHVSHIKVVYGKGTNRAMEILHLLDSARLAGIHVTADFYPYTASHTGIAILFPDWAKKPNDYDQVLETRREELTTFLRNKVIQRNGPEATLMGAGSDFKGRTLAQIADSMGKPFEKVLVEDIGPYGGGGAYFIMDSLLQQTLLTDPYVMVCTDGSPGMRHPRGYGTFAKIIEQFVGKDVLTLAEAVRKMTSLPAETLGIEDRGLIETGKKADLTIFDPQEVKETATYPQPFQLARGFSYVIVNGLIALENEAFSEKRNGKVLNKKNY